MKAQSLRGDCKKKRFGLCPQVLSKHITLGRKSSRIFRRTPSQVLSAKRSLQIIQSVRPLVRSLQRLASTHVSLEHIFVIIFLTSDSLTDNLINVTLGMSRNRESMACYACIGQSVFLRALVSQLPEKLSYIYSEHSRKKVNIITAFFSLIILHLLQLLLLLLSLFANLFHISGSCKTNVYSSICCY